MYVVEVLLVRGAVRQGSYTYFSTIEYLRGTVLEVPLRGGTETGVVLESKPAQLMKTALRAATFSLRKLAPQENTYALSPNFLSIVDEMSLSHGAQPGAVIASLLPDDMLLLPLYVLRKDVSNADEKLPLRSFERFLLTDTEHGRFVTYKALVREALAQMQSVIIVAPTRVLCEHLYRELRGGIGDRTVLLMSGLGKSKKREAVEVITESTLPVLVIATPAYAHIERSDVGVVVLEGARAAAFRERNRPHLDFVASLTAHARMKRARLVLSDTLQKTEHEHLLSTRGAFPIGEHLKRIVLQGTLRVVSLPRDNDSSLPFRIFGSEALALIKNTFESNGRMFVYSARRGLASLVACLDCGNILRDPDGAPLSLHVSSEDGVEKRWLYSSVSGFRVPAFDLCPLCGSWRLRERGIGIQAVARELEEQFPKKTPLIFDASTATSHKKARAIQAALYEEGGTLLVGTQAALPYLEESVDNSLVASADSLLAIPSWRQTEEALNIIFTLREKTLHTVLVQTRHQSEHDIFTYGASGDISSFYDAEIALRRDFKYPPFSVFVLLTYRGKKSVLTHLEADLQKMFAAHTPEFYGMPFTLEGLYTRRCLLRIPADRWPHKETSALLAALPPHVRVEINPDRIV